MAGRPPALQIKISNPNLFLLSFAPFVRVYRFGDDPFHQFPQPSWAEEEEEEALVGFPHSMIAEGGPGLHSALFGSSRVKIYISHLLQILWTLMVLRVVLIKVGSIFSMFNPIILH